MFVTNKAHATIYSKRVVFNLFRCKFTILTNNYSVYNNISYIFRAPQEELELKV